MIVSESLVDYVFVSFDYLTICRSYCVSILMLRNLHKLDFYFDDSNQSWFAEIDNLLLLEHRGVLVLGLGGGEPPVTDTHSYYLLSLIHGEVKMNLNRILKRPDGCFDP